MVDVDVVDAGCGDLDEQLARSRRWIGQLDQAQHLRAADLGDLDRPHGASLRVTGDSSPGQPERQAAGAGSPRGWRSVFGQASQVEVESIDAIVAAELEHIDPDEWQ